MVRLSIIGVVMCLGIHCILVSGVRLLVVLFVGFVMTVRVRQSLH